MYDIKIFLEDDGRYWAVATLGKEKVYALGNTQQELMQELREGIELAGNNHPKRKKLENFLVYT